ncbi:MAG: HlyD family efflux transporter periplasmic adaptor subunit [Pseudohongiellaceae bacterium]
MSLDAKTMLGKLRDRLPGGVRDQWINARDRFLAARRSTRYLIAGGAGVVVVALLMVGIEATDSSQGSVTFEARRGPLNVTVLEGGALEALNSQEIRSGVRGREGAQILSIVEEGYRVTDEDVRNGKVLVELDTAQLIDERLNQEIGVETAEAGYIERKAELEIQINQNLTDLNDARQTMKFARLDFEKFLGADIVNEIIGTLEIEERLARAEAIEAEALEEVTQTLDSRRGDFSDNLNTGVAVDSRQHAFDLADIDTLPPQMQERIRQMMADNDGEVPQDMLDRMQQFQGGGFSGGQFDGRGPAGDREPLEEGDSTTEMATILELAPEEADAADIGVTQLLMDAEYMAIRNQIDFTRYADLDMLADGEAKQQLRNLYDDVQVAEQEYLLAQDRVEGQRRLEVRGFITPTELEAEELKINKAVNREQETETALNLYIQYTFPKDAEKLLSDYENAVMAYQRTLKENIAEQAQEQARFKSAEKKFNLERERLVDINQQITAATIHALRPGLVVYGAADQNSQRRRGNQEAIQEGATVRERQPILTIPDMREMVVKVNIHESAVKRVAVGQRANIVVDAYPNIKLTGRVLKVAVVADSANSFMNPDMKVYPTSVLIDGEYDWLRPGMSAEVEILVNSLDDVVYVPLQAVTYYNDDQVVYVSNNGRTQRRVVEVGDFSEQFIEIVSGLQEGEEVLLLPPGQGFSG